VKRRKGESRSRIERANERQTDARRRKENRRG
jgi:hypothetical protein